MNRFFATFLACGLAIVATTGQAQQIDCSAPENAELEQCLGEGRLAGVRNFVPLLGPLLGTAVLTALAAGESGSTPNTNQ